MVSKRHSKSAVRLTDRDRVVLEHVALYGLTVREAIQELPCFATASKHAAEGVRRRLLRGRYLGQQELGSQHYRNAYYLQRKGRDALGDTQLHFGPLADAPRIRAFALLAFCCLQEEKRELLSLAEFKTSFPALYQPQRRVNYYIDSSGAKPRLAYLRVDFGRSETIPVERLLAYCRRDTGNLLALPTAMEMVARDALQITLLTAMPQKAMIIHRMISQLDDPSQMLPIPVCVHHVPQLRELIAPICH